MNKLDKIAKRISEISDEIKDLKSEREVNLEVCHPSEDEEFESTKRWIDYEWRLKENCAFAAYKWVKEEVEENGYQSATFEETIKMYGCKNCIAAYEAKKAIGVLRRERGRLVGNITKIGRAL